MGSTQKVQTLEYVEWAAKAVFFWPIESNSKNTEDDVDNFTFFIEGEAFSNVWEINKAVWDILQMEATRGKILT